MLATGRTDRLLTAAASGGAILPVSTAAQPLATPYQQQADRDLAKKLANPIANLISVPFQENLDFGIGPNEGPKSTLNFQPVIPIGLDEHWSIVLRMIVPIVYQDDVNSLFEDQFGLGNTLQSSFFSPKNPSPDKIVWVLGPVLLCPSATERRLGSDKVGAGPTQVIVKQAGHNTFGMLTHHIWSFAGDNDCSGLSTTFVQSFLSRTTPSAATYSINTETSYDWKNESWLVPFNLSVAQLTRIVKQPISIGGGVRYYVEKPNDGSECGIRLIFTLLFPKA